MAAAGRVCASTKSGALEVQPGDRLGVDLLALSELLQTPIARYRVLDVVGGGGLGIVLAAWDERLRRRVAIKALRRRADPTHGDATIRQEAQALAALSHPRVVDVFDVVEQAGQFFLVMELVLGTTLRTWQASRPRAEVVGAYTAVAEGLAAVHAAGLIHCDVKPDNVLVAEDGRVLVADFGFAVLARSEAQHGQLTGGTPRYMAPEQRRGERLTPACDQFGLCVALWEALSGQLPPEAASSIPRPLRRALRRGLADDAAARWPSVSALGRAIEPPRSALRSPLWASAAAVGLLGASGLIYTAWGGASEPTTGRVAAEAEVKSESLTDTRVADALVRAAVHRRQGRLRAAEQTLRDASADDLGAEERARLQLAHVQALDRLGDVRAAAAELATLERDTADVSDRMRADVALEVVRLGLGKDASSNPQQWLEMAAASLRRAGIDPDTDVRMQFISGDLADIQGRHDDASAHYRVAVEQLDDDQAALVHVHVLAEYGASLRRLGKHADARAALQRAQTLVETKSLQGSDAALRLLIARGNSEAHAGDRATGIALLQRAIADAEGTEFDPSVVGGALRDLGAYCLEENRLAEGLDALSRAEVLLPRSYSVQSNLAMYWSKIPCANAVGAAAITECKDEAVARGHAHEVHAYELGRETHGPDHPSVAQLGGNLMYSYLQLGDVEQARKYAAPTIAGLRASYGDDHARMLRPLLSTIEVHVRLGDRALAMESVVLLEGAANANAAALGDAANHVVQYVLGRTRIWAERARDDDAARVQSAVAGLGPVPPDDIRMVDSWFDGTDPLANSR